jgi:hypothetical protein
LPPSRARTLALITLLVTFALLAVFGTPWNAKAPRDGGGPPAAIEIRVPAPYQVFQRDAQDLGSIPIEGRCSGSATVIEARFASGPWTVIDRAPDCSGAGAFQGWLSNQRAGQGVLRVRFAQRDAISDMVTPVGIGDVFVIAGQSNAVMIGKNTQRFEHPELLAGAYTLDDVWKIGHDPIHKSTASNGSSWPLLATLLMGTADLPVAFIATAKKSTGLVRPPDWEPGNPMGRGLYERMLEQVREATLGARMPRAILWFQGEADLVKGVGEDAYLAALLNLAGNVEEDLPGTSLVVGVLGSGLLAFRGVESIRGAQREAAALRSDDNILGGPETYDIEVVDPWRGVHFTTDGALRTIAERWCQSLSGPLYGPLDCNLASFERTE